MTTSPPSGQAVAEWVADWYRALDRHDPLDELWLYLDESDLTFTFPEGVFKGPDEFRGWYEAVTHRFFDEEHTVREVTVAEPWADGRATIKVVVNWQARIWDPPAAKSAWLGFDAYQTWQITLDHQGRPRISNYVVDRLAAMPGSASL